MASSSTTRSPERQALADALAHRQRLQDEQGRLNAAIDAWEGRAAARQHVEEAEARLDELHGEARDRRVQAALNPDAGIAQIGRDKIDDAEQAVDRARRELADLEETAAAMKKLAADPDRRAQLQMAETDVENAVADVIMAELPVQTYLNGRLAIAAYHGARRAPPAPAAEDLERQHLAWENFERQLLRGEVDAPAPNLHSDGT